MNLPGGIQGLDLRLADIGQSWLEQRSSMSFYFPLDRENFYNKLDLLEYIENWTNCPILYIFMWADILVYKNPIF